ncbi:MAG: hypothetical protein LBQ94_00825 [Treponema sp.]|jgi:hypothetical protein|nr:hypothetical protein [Treponema sp.]
MKKKKPPKKLVSSTKLTRTTLKEDVGKLLLDVGKLVFAGIVITRVLYRQLNIVDESIFQDILLIGGSAVVAVCFILGIFLGKREIKTEKTRFRRRKRSRR